MRYDKQASMIERAYCVSDIRFLTEVWRLGIDNDVAREKIRFFIWGAASYCRKDVAKEFDFLVSILETMEAVNERLRKPNSVQSSNNNFYQLLDI